MLSRKYREITKGAHKRYQDLSKEEKEKKQKHGCERYGIFRNMKNEILLSIENILRNKKTYLIIIKRNNYFKK